MILATAFVLWHGIHCH